LRPDADLGQHSIWEQDAAQKDRQRQANGGRGQTMKKAFTRNRNGDSHTGLAGPKSSSSRWRWSSFGRFPKVKRPWCHFECEAETFSLKCRGDLWAGVISRSEKLGTAF